MLPANNTSPVSDVDGYFEELGIDEMGEGELRQLHEYLDNLLTEDDEYFGEGSESMFSDLCLDRQPTPSTSTKDNSSSSVFQSPIRHRTQRRPLGSATNAADISLRVTLPALDQYEEMLRSCDLESCDLMDKAMGRLCDAYSLIDNIDSLVKESFPSQRRIPGSVVEQPNDQQENIPPASSREAASTASVPPSSRKVPKVDESQTVAVLDKRLRPVLAPAPGKTLYRHDPVTAINMYMEEWKRLPTPGEQQRLSLRWKVRDLMMSRRFMPKKHPTGGVVDHPKDWSPRPYLD